MERTWQLKGIMPPMVTPFAADESVDEEALARETRYLLSLGVHGLVVCGSTGEGAGLSPEETGPICQTVVKEAGGRVPVIAGVIADTTREALRLCRVAKEAGVDALQITPPHYLFAPFEEGLYRYYETIGAEMGLPIIIYNVIPGVDITTGLVARLVESGQVIGIKQSGGDMHKLADMIVAVGDKASVMSAVDDLLFPSFALGAHGSIAAIATVLPQLCLELYQAVQEKDWDTARDLHQRILPVWRAVEGPAMPARVKEALNLLGRPVGRARTPQMPCSPEEREQIRQALGKAGLLKV